MGASVSKVIAGLDLKARAASVVGYVRGLDPAEMKAQAKTVASHAIPYLREIADPRGRCNRKAFLHIALAFLAIQLACTAVFWLLDIELGLDATILMNAPILWIGTTICFKRLHDVGLRGWWLPGAFSVWLVVAMIIATILSMVLGDAAVAQGQPAFYAIFAIITLPTFGALLWLHTAPSVAGSNQFGPAPGASGLSMPARELASGAAAMSNVVMAA
jgi:uncharacterized membrane protein YhaH (DUF805 family)